MTDGEVVQIARKIDELLGEVHRLCDDIQASSHPNADRIVSRLSDNGIPVMAWATHCVSDDLQHPERWETGDFGIRSVRGIKAAHTRWKRQRQR